MKVSARVVVPVFAALLIVGLLLGVLWWQLMQARQAISLHIGAGRTEIPDTSLGDSQLFDAGDQVLMHLRQGDLLGLQGEWAGAEREYQASVDAGGGLPALQKLAQAQLQRRDITGAKATIVSMQKAGAKPEDLLLLNVNVALRTGELVQAEDLLAKAGDSPQKHYGLALLAIIQGNNDNARKELAQVQAGWDPQLRSYAQILQGAYDEYALFPESPQIHLTTLLGRSLAQVGQCELALPLLAEVVKTQDDYRDAWIVQGYCQLTTGREQDALASFERAYALDPEKPEIQYFLGRTYAALKDPKNALTFFQYALQNGFSPEKEVRQRLARAAGDANQPALALDQYRMLSEGSGGTGAFLDQYVKAAIALGQKEPAYQEASKAIARWPTSAKAFEMLGWAAMETNRKEEAKAALEKAIELDPNLQSVRDRLRNL